MKKIIAVITFFLLWNIANSQIYLPNPPVGYGNNFNRINPQIALHLPIFSDTASSHTNISNPQIGYYNGAIYAYYDGHYHLMSAGIASIPSNILNFDSTLGAGFFQVGGIDRGVGVNHEIVAFLSDLNDITGDTLVDNGFPTQVLNILDTPLADATDSSIYLIVKFPRQKLADSSTNPFYTHGNDATQLIDGAYTFFVPSNNQTVTNAANLGFYQYYQSIDLWKKVNRPFLIGGGGYKIDQNLFVKDTYSLVFGTSNLERGRFTSTGSFKINSWQHSGSSTDSDWSVMALPDGTSYVKRGTTLTVDGTTITGDGTPANPLVSHSSGGGGGTVESVSSADANSTVSDPTVNPIITIVSAPKLQIARTLSITGDLGYTSPSFDGSGNVTAAGTLATVNSNAGSFGDATHVGAFTVNGKGLITAASSVAITGFAPSFTVTSPITYSSNVISIQQANTSQDGYLSHNDLTGYNLIKPAVAVVSTSNLTLSGEQTIDGQTTNSSLVLLTAQTTGSENGFWITASGAWARPVWFANGSTYQAPQFLTTFVRLGATYQGTTWRMTTASVTIGTTSTAWVETPLVLNSTSVTGLLPVANGGTGTATPGIVAGTNITVTGTWPNQTVNSTGGGGGSPAGNYNDIQLNRNGVFSTPASDSLMFNAGLSVNNRIFNGSTANNYLTLRGNIATSGNTSTSPNLMFRTNNVGAGDTAMIMYNSGNFLFGNYINTPTALATLQRVSFSSQDYGSNAAGSPANLKWIMFGDPNTSVATDYGIGMYANTMQITAGTSGGFSFWTNGSTNAMNISSGGVVSPLQGLNVTGAITGTTSLTLNSGVSTPTSSASPLTIDTKLLYGSGATYAASNMKIQLYTGYGLTMQSGAIGLQAPSGAEVGLAVNSIAITKVSSSGMTTIRPIAYTGSTPTNSLGTGAGTSASASITGNDATGSITITTGTTPTAGGNVITVTFATALASTAKAVQLTAANENAAIDFTKIYVDLSGTTNTVFVLKNVSTAALQASTTYKFYYTVTQ